MWCSELKMLSFPMGKLTSPHSGNRGQETFALSTQMHNFSDFWSKNHGKMYTFWTHLGVWRVRMMRLEGRKSIYNKILRHQGPDMNTNDMNGRKPQKSFRMRSTENGFICELGGMAKRRINLQQVFKPCKTKPFCRLKNTFLTARSSENKKLVIIYYYSLHFQICS